MGNVKSIYGEQIILASSPYDALTGADALIVCTEWNEFRTPDFERIGSLMRERVLFDGRNLYDALKMSEMCSHYESIGR
jgi:UDPglucose 6-dehydrogenase